MRSIEPQALTPENFRPFGRYYPLGTLAEDAGSVPAFLPHAPIRGPLHFGATSVKGGSFQSTQMERHVLGEEILLCGDQPMVLTVADSDPEDQPFTRDVRSFYMHPGDVVILNKGIWHDANHGMAGPCTYFFIAEDTEGQPNRERETQWVPIVPQGVSVLLPHAARPLRGGNSRQDAQTFSLGNRKNVTDLPGFSGADGWTGFFDPEKTPFAAAQIGWIPIWPTGGKRFQSPAGPVSILCGAAAVDFSASPGEDTGMPQDHEETILLQYGDIVSLHRGTWFSLRASFESGVFVMLEEGHRLKEQLKIP